LLKLLLPNPLSPLNDDDEADMDGEVERHPPPNEEDAEGIGLRA